MKTPEEEENVEQVENEDVVEDKVDDVEDEDEGNKD